MRRVEAILLHVERDPVVIAASDVAVSYTHLPEKDIQIYINSPGGSVSAGLGIYDTMQLVNSDVATICTGLALSLIHIYRSCAPSTRRNGRP